MCERDSGHNIVDAKKLHQHELISTGISTQPHLTLAEFIFFSDFLCVCYCAHPHLHWEGFCQFVPVSHPAAPWSGTLRQSMSGCRRLPPPRSFSWLMLLGRKGRVELLEEGCLWLWCCEFLWLATWLVFFKPPFWWATAERKDTTTCYRRAPWTEDELLR